MNEEEGRFTAKYSKGRSTKDLLLLLILNQCLNIIEHVLYNNLLIFSPLFLKLSVDSLGKTCCLLVSMRWVSGSRSTAEVSYRLTHY